MHAYPAKIQSRFSRKQSLKRKIFILYFQLLFSRRITPFPLVPPVTNHPVYIRVYSIFKGIVIIQENSNFLDRKHFRVTDISPSTNHRQTHEEASVFRNLPSLRVNSHCFVQGPNSLFFLLFVTDCESLGVVRWLHRLNAQCPRCRRSEDNFCYHEDLQTHCPLSQEQSVFKPSNCWDNWPNWVQGTSRIFTKIQRLTSILWIFKSLDLSISSFFNIQG